MSTLVIARNENAVNQVMSLIDEYAHGAQVSNNIGVIITDNPLVMIGALNEYFSVSSILKDPAVELEKAYNSLSRKLDSFSLLIYDTSNKSVYYIDGVSEIAIIEDNFLVTTEKQICYLDNLRSCDFDERMMIIQDLSQNLSISIEISV